MGTFIKIILVVIFTFRIVSDCGVFQTKVAVLKIAVEDEESKNEKGKEIEKDALSDSEKLLLVESHHEVGYDILGQLSILSIEQSPTIKFRDKPDTPPPDFI